MKTISQEAKSAIIEALKEKVSSKSGSFGFIDGYDDGLHDAVMVVESFQVSDGWIPVSERNPNERGHYLVYFPNGDMSTARFDPRYVEENKWMWSKANGYLPPSHYKPLPNPPTSHK